jgi:hypothetical protein
MKITRMDLLLREDELPDPPPPQEPERSAVERGTDIHTRIAREMFGTETPTDEQREAARTANFAALYGGRQNQVTLTDVVEASDLSPDERVHFDFETEGLPSRYEPRLRVGGLMARDAEPHRLNMVSVSVDYAALEMRLMAAMNETAAVSAMSTLSSTHTGRMRRSRVERQNTYLDGLRQFLGHNRHRR